VLQSNGTQDKCEIKTSRPTNKSTVSMSLTTLREWLPGNGILEACGKCVTTV